MRTGSCLVHSVNLIVLASLGFVQTEPELISRMAPGHSSRLYVFPVSKGMVLDDEVLESVAGGSRVMVGLYGMEARHKAYSVGLRADSVFNGLNL